MRDDLCVAELTVRFACVPPRTARALGTRGNSRASHAKRLPLMAADACRENVDVSAAESAAAVSGSAAGGRLGSMCQALCRLAASAASRSSVARLIK